VLSELAAGSYQPVLDDGLQYCLQHLPWWAEGQQLEQQQQQPGVQLQLPQQSSTAPPVQAESGSAAVSHLSTLGRLGFTDSTHRRHARARVWLKRQKRNLGGPGKLVL